MSCSRILILRPDNIGDVVLFSGAFRHIRGLYPDAHITLAVQTHIVNLVELCPYIDVCVPISCLTWWGRFENIALPFDKYRLKKLIDIINKICNKVRRPFDIIIYPVKSPQVKHLETINCLSARQIFGITGCSINAPKNGYPSALKLERLYTNCFDVSKIDPWRHELLTTYNFLRFLGCLTTTFNNIKPQFWLSNSEINHLDGVQKNGRKIIGLFPGASFEIKNWDPFNYGDFAVLLGGQPIYAIFGSPAQKTLNDRVEFSIRERCEDVEILNLTGQTTLRELINTITSCDLLIGVDTSGLHMAISAGMPTIGIVGGGHFGRFVPWGDSEKNIFLTKKMECFNCNWVCTKEEVECIRGVSPYEVAFVVNNMLDGES